LPTLVGVVEAPQTERVRLRRGPAKGRYERAAVHGVLDDGLLAHVAFLDADGPVCVPMLYVRVGDIVYIHGSVGSRAIRCLSTRASACVTVTNLRGLVLARSAFEHSANYEAVMVFGVFTAVEAVDERLAAFEAFTEKLLPGRWGEVRPPSDKELSASAILALDLAEAEASVKVRTGPPDDDDGPDAGLDTWAGVLPLALAFGPPQPTEGLRPGIALSPSVRRLIEVGP
jgi:nitroimidazol reductase NimA-like FMN-containing flavoprotein (pyridoxamine 5'-phosphate oxidase superfamily)